MRVRDRELERRLRELRAPDEAEAEERSWLIVREAYRGRTPLARARRYRAPALALAGGLAVVAVGLSPAGAKVGDLVSDVVGISGDEAKPELRSLPAAGEVLVESRDGAWIVRADGSKRLLGDYREAAWSPRGLYVVAATDDELVALEPDGTVRWTAPTPAPARHLSWAGLDLHTRIAYVVGGDLHVIAGDGTGAHRVARNVTSAPTWVPIPAGGKLNPPAPGTFPLALAYLDRSGGLRTVDPDTGGKVDALAPLPPTLRRELAGGSVPSPFGSSIAEVRTSGGRSVVAVRAEGDRRVVFSGPGRITQPTWSPDGRWLLFGWREADQWVFVQPDRPRRVIAIDAISEQFAPGENPAGGFPRVSGWLLPQR